MAGKFFDWLDHRTGYRKLKDAMLLEHIPGGAKWRYVWGSALAFVFMIQLVTGVLLMTAYSPGDSTAWGSVYFIQYEMDFGWLIRGLHHYGSQTMVVLLGLHMLQVVIAGAHLPPREVNWWLGLMLMGIVLALSLTGYLLPWDQKGYYATRVATNIAGSIPGIGEFIKTLLVGGKDFGNHTLTRFYALHVGILPPLMIVLLIAHIAVFRRQGVTAPANAKGEGWFWPDQAFRDLLVCLAIFGVMLALVLFSGHGNKIATPVGVWTNEREGKECVFEFSQDAFTFTFKEGENLIAKGTMGIDPVANPKQLDLTATEGIDKYKGKKLLGIYELDGRTLRWCTNQPGAQDRPDEIPSQEGEGKHLTLFLRAGWYQSWAKAGRDGLGANLDAPADRETQGYPARPEWYFLFLFQLLKLFDGDLLLVGTVVIPNGAMLLLFLLPLFGHGRMRKFGHGLGVFVVVLLLGSVAVLTVLAFADDSPEPILFGLVGNKAILDDKGELDMSTDEAKERNGKVLEARGFQHRVHEAEILAKRAVQLASERIPEEGGRELLRKDPLTRGVKLFEKNCAGCHKFSTGPERPEFEGFAEPSPEFRAPDLAGWGTEEWILGLLTKPSDERYFGAMHFTEGEKKGKLKLTGMITWRKGVDTERKTMTDKEKEDQDDDFKLIARWLAYQKVPKGKRTDTQLDIAGTKAFYASGCKSCHTAEAYLPKKGEPGKFAHKIDGNQDGPSLVNYGTPEWIRFMVMSPAHISRYGATKAENYMPAFRPLEGPGTEVALDEFKEKYENLRVIPLSDIDRELIIRWMLRDYRVVFGGQTISAASKKE